MWTLFETQSDDARETGDPAAIEGLVKAYLEMANPFIKTRRKAFLEEQGQVFTSASKDRHDTLRQIASNTGPSNTGAAPVERSVMPSSGKRPDETQVDYYERRLREKAAQTR